MKEFKNRFSAGSAQDAYKYLGSFLKGNTATFRVWAPNAESVAVVGDFNSWDPVSDIMKNIGYGIWEKKINGLKNYDVYKYAVTGRDGRTVLKSDPYARHYETAPANASKLYNSCYKWNDEEWQTSKKNKNIYESPVNIYEVHAGSWKHFEGGNTYDYVTLARELAKYVKKMNYTHVELLPVTEYPFEGSWGYQVSGYFAPTSRYGTPDDFKKFVDIMHENNIGVILDWVPAHFPKDEFGLYRFDGTPCYEYADPRKGEHKEWGTVVFDYARPEVKSFLVSSAVFWLKEYHADGLRVDAVASMLYLDYGRQGGEWVPNSYGGRENLEAVEFLKAVNTAAFAADPSVMMIAEESTAWPMITKPADVGGLGFNFKWNMGWANDMFEYMQTDPYFRSGIHNKLTFPMMYAFSENYILPVSHDEVVHGKKSLLDKMFGEYEDKFRAMRVFMAYMMTLPGKKMLFMGTEYGPFREWDYENELEWFMLKYPAHHAMHDYIRALNKFYLSTPALYEIDDSWEGFEWIDADLAAMNLISYRRIDTRGRGVYVVLNFAPVEWDYEMRVKRRGEYEVIFSSDDKKYGGSGTAGEGTTYRAYGKKIGDKTEQLIKMKIPSYGALILKSKSPAKKK